MHFNLGVIMFKKSVLLLILVLFLAIGVVSAHDDNSTVVNQTMDDIKVNDTSSVTTSSVDDCKLVGSNVNSVYGKTVKFSVNVLKSNKKPIKNRLVSFHINNKDYSAYSNSKGVATISLKLNAGKYKITYSSVGVSASSTIVVKNSYSIKVFKWKTGADVCKNKKIKKNLPDSSLVRKVIKAAKKGTPLVIFKGGNGKKVFITAGVHGNELSPQIAALKLVKYLQSNPIDGTVYIMPFVHPKATSKNVRNLNYNLNSKANVKGTVSYKIVKLIVKYKCKAYGDFHSSKPGGDPGMNVAMGTYKPTSGSALMAMNISKMANVKYLIYAKAGEEYPGALEDVVNLKHIPAVTCEVLTPHGKIAKGSVSTSLLMMKAFLKFNGEFK